MTDIVIVAAARTAVGKFGGTLAKTPAPELGAAVIVELLKRAKLSADQINEVILGQVLQAGAGQNPARQSVIKAGLPSAVPAMTINKVCGSGLKAVMLAAQAIRDGDSDIVIAGWKPADLDLLEINEAFAAQACAVHKEMGWDTSKVNVNGGAIAIGHPIGASGCRILVTLLHEMQRRNAKKGIASLCIGGGMGVALTIER
jgi:acetyl-CoA acetyltransferase